MQHALFREAISIVENGIAEAGDVDDAIKYGFGMRLGVSGPMEVIDRGGLDLTYSIHKYLFPHIESSAEPSKLMVQLMDEGKLGFEERHTRYWRDWSSDVCSSDLKHPMRR